MKRDSNAELLRILCIIFILLHHFCVHALYPEVVREQLTDSTWDAQLAMFLHGFIYIGVNCFVLISGFYGIKTTMRHFLKLYLTYAFFSVLALLYTIGYTYIFVSRDFSLDFKALMHSFVTFILPFRLGELWFMTCYFILFMIAPFLNITLEHLNKKQFAFMLIILTYLNFYFGYFSNSGVINNAGCNIVHFVWLYFIGGFIGRYITQDFHVRNRWRYFAGYFFGACLWGTLSCMSANGINVPLWKTFCYHNPILLVNTICFFLFVMSFRIQSKFIIFLAASTLGVYIMNEKVVGYQLIKPFSHVFSPLTNIAVWFILTLIFYVLAIVFDKLLALIVNPLVKFSAPRLDSKWQKWVKKVEKRIEKVTE